MSTWSNQKNTPHNASFTHPFRLLSQSRHLSPQNYKERNRSHKHRVVRTPGVSPQTISSVFYGSTLTVISPSCPIAQWFNSECVDLYPMESPKHKSFMGNKVGYASVWEDKWKRTNVKSSVTSKEHPNFYSTKGANATETAILVSSRQKATNLFFWSSPSTEEDSFTDEAESAAAFSSVFSSSSPFLDPISESTVSPTAPWSLTLTACELVFSALSVSSGTVSESSTSLGSHSTSPEGAWSGLAPVSDKISSSVAVAACSSSGLASWLWWWSSLSGSDKQDPATLSFSTDLTGIEWHRV